MMGIQHFHFVKHYINLENSFAYFNRHTGGSLGAYEKISALAPKLNVMSPVKRLDVYGKKSSN